LIKLLIRHPELGIIFEEILEKTDEKLIVLFGSYAKGLAKRDSDIDIYIETKSRNLKKVIESIHPKINVKIGTFDTKSPLIKEIIKDHIIIRGIEVFYEKKQFFE
jgi:Nucleotidyltransferase domain.